MKTRIGELLGRIVSLSRQDVAEILEEQKMSHLRFGQIALSWGLCQPVELWQAWGDQMAQFPERVDLEEIGIDTQALRHVPREIALALGVIPVRALEDRVVVAISEQTPDAAIEQLPIMLKKSIQFVLADPRQIAEALRHVYPRRAQMSGATPPLRRTA